MSKILTSQITDLLPDWRILYTIEEAERELGYEFTQLKEINGWHLFEKDTLLIFPSEVEGKYWFWTYNNRNPHIQFAAIANACVSNYKRQ